MAKELIKPNIRKEPNKLYFCKPDIDGYLVVCEAELKRGGRKKKEKEPFVPLEEELKKKEYISKLKFWRKE